MGAHRPAEPSVSRPRGIHHLWLVTPSVARLIGDAGPPHARPRTRHGRPRILLGFTTGKYAFLTHHLPPGWWGPTLVSRTAVPAEPHSRQYSLRRRLTLAPHSR